MVVVSGYVYNPSLGRREARGGRWEWAADFSLACGYVFADACSLRIEYINVVCCSVVYYIVRAAWRSVSYRNVMSWCEMTASQYGRRRLRCNVGVDVSCPACVGYVPSSSIYQKAGHAAPSFVLEPFLDVCPAWLDQRVQLGHERDEPHQVAADEGDDEG